MIRALLILAVLAVARPAAAHLPLPADQVRPDTVLWLARAFVGEAGWVAKRDHAAMAWVLVRRWRRARSRYPAWRFNDQIKVYVKALGMQSATPTRRQLWVRSLRGDGPPAGWPAGAHWSRHLPWWRAARARAERWLAGDVRDPCGGRAWNWGGTIDVQEARDKGLRRVDCGPTKNTFYDDGST